MIIYDNKKFKKFISNKEITNRVLDLSKELNKYYRSKDLVIICVLNGSVMVLNELVKK